LDVMEVENVPKNQRLSHYEFLKAIAIAWIDLDEEDLRDRRRRLAKASANKRTHDDIMEDVDPTVQVDCYLTPSAQKRSKHHEEEEKKSPAVSDRSLAPGGALKCRLNRSLSHYPELPTQKKRPKCALHRWACGRASGDVRSNVFLCSCCRVCLCIQCFRLFHEEAELVSKKDEIAKLMLTKKEEE